MGCGASNTAAKAELGDIPEVFITKPKDESNPPSGPKLPPTTILLETPTMQDYPLTETEIPEVFTKRRQDPNCPVRKSTSRVTISSTGPYMKTLEEKFPGAIPEDFFIQQATEILAKNDFTASNAINLVSTCRDEICRTFTLELDRLWGPSFSISSLAGMVFCGRTGFKAAMAHSPVIGGKERYIFWVMPHIGLSSDGHFGRYGRLRCSTS